MRTLIPVGGQKASLKVSRGCVVFRVKLVMSDTLLICGQVCAKRGMCEFVIRDWKVKSQNMFVFPLSLSLSLGFSSFALCSG